MILESAMAIAGAVQAVGGLLNYFEQKGFNDQQKEQFQKLYDEAMKIVPPEMKPPEYEQYKAADPYQITDYSPERSEYTNEGSMAIDQGARQKQIDVLNQLEQMYKSGGMDPQSVAAMAEAQNQANQNAKSQRDSVAALAQRQGRGGSNLDYLMQEQAGQQDANRLNMAGLNAASDARSRALQAMGMFSSQASNLRNQDFSQEQSIAKAKDIYNQFNTNNMNDALRYKTEQQNQLAKSQWANKQDISDRNVGLANKSKDLVNQYAQDKFNNQIKQLGVVSGAAGDYTRASGSATDSMTKGVGDFTTGLSGLAKDYGKMYDTDYQDYLNNKKYGSDFTKGGY